MGLFDKFKKKPQAETPAPTQKTVSVLMQDGTTMEYPESFIITDHENAVICQGKFYHTSLDCNCLKWERDNSSEPLKAIYIKDAKKQKMVYCADCSKDLYDYERN